MDQELQLPALSPRVEAEVVARMLSRDRDAWAHQAARVGHCSKPVRLRGRTLTVDTRTGEVRTAYASDWEESGVAFIRCGNRRESVCVACSREYASDTWHLISAGAAGGDKGVPTSVSEHPMMFATLTPSSFGLVHSAKKPGTVGSTRCRQQSHHPATRGHPAQPLPRPQRPLPPIRLHDLRHSTRPRCSSKGYVHVVANRLGHSARR